MTSIKVRTNRHWYAFKCRAEVPRKVLLSQFDWMIPKAIRGNAEAIENWRKGEGDDVGDYWDGFFCHRGFWQHTSEYMRCESLPDWHGAHHDSMSCGTLLRLNDDGDRYQIATFCS